ncbi:hypothetical protein ACOME3_007862 [Neoechinorhynchus agilis]
MNNVSRIPKNINSSEVLDVEMQEAIESLDIATDKATEDSKRTVYPISRIKTIVKSDPEQSGFIASEAIFLLTKAAEEFTCLLGNILSEECLKSNKKTVSSNTIKDAIENYDSLSFLSGCFDN